MTGGQCIDRREGIRWTYEDAGDAHAAADQRNRSGHRLRPDRPAGPENPPRYLSQRFSEVGWIAALQRAGWYVCTGGGGHYEAHAPHGGYNTLLGYQTEGDAWAAARDWHNDLCNGLRKAGGPKV